MYTFFLNFIKFLYCIWDRAMDGFWGQNLFSPMELTNIYRDKVILGHRSL